MPLRTTTYDYEVSSEAGRERHVVFPWSRLVDVTPALHDPFCVASRIIGLNICGTVITLGSVADPYIVGNVAEGAIYAHNVSNVCSWAAGDAAPDAFCQISIGDPVFYDIAADALYGIKLSLASLYGNETTVRPLFGFVVMMQEEDASDFPKGSVEAASPALCAVLQAGLNSRDAV